MASITARRPSVALVLTLASIVALALVLVLASGCTREVQAAVAVGEPAPAFTLPDEGGGTRSLSQYAGKTVVLEWLNHGCPFVRKHYGSGNMQRLQETYTGKGVVWLSIISSAPGKQGHCTPAEAAAQKTEKSSHATAVLLDPSGEVGRSYGAATTPHMFVVDPEGDLAYQGAIDSIASTSQKDVAAAKSYVALALDALLAGEPVPVPSTAPYGCSVKY